MGYGRVIIYRDRTGKWWWRFVAGNGMLMADSGQGYTRRSSACRAWECLADSLRHKVIHPPLG